MDKEKRLAAARKKLQDYKKARGESAGGSGTGGKETGETVPVISGNSSSSGSDSSMIIINPQYILENNGSNNFASVVPGAQESDLEILSTPTPSPSLFNDDSKVPSQQQSSAASSYADEHSGNLISQTENISDETQLPVQGITYGAPHSTTSSVPDSDNEQFVFLNPPSGQDLQEIPLYNPQPTLSTAIQLPQLYIPSYGNTEPTDSVEMHTFAHNYNQPLQLGQGYSSSSFTPIGGADGFHSQPPGIPMHHVPVKPNENEQSLIQVPPQPIFIDPNPILSTTSSYLPNLNTSSPPLTTTSSSIQDIQPSYPTFYQPISPPGLQNTISDPLTANNPYFYPPQEEASTVILQPATPQVQFADVHSQVNSRPNSRRSNRSQEVDDKEDKDQNIVELQRMQSVQDALELQMEELSRDNTRLLNRQSELLAQLEENEKVLQELRRERDHCKEDAKKSLQPLHAKVNSLYEENQRIIKSSSDQYNELMSKVEEKTRQFQEMEQAFIVVSQSKMEFAAQLDQEREKWKESEYNMISKDEEILKLKEANAKLEERLKIELQKEAVSHQLEDQRRHFQVQSETLQGELERANERIKSLERMEKQTIDTSSQRQVTSAIPHVHDHQSGHHHSHPEESISEEHHHSDSCDHEHGASDHSEEHEHHHSHEDDHHDHDHSDDQHGHSHDHHGHSHSHDHDDHHHASEPSSAESKRSKSLSLQEELTELKKTLLRMEWENTTYRTELDRLAVDVKAKQAYENNYNLLKADSDKMKEEIERLEHLVIQLQGENDTIGDYITLYQSQRLALRERAKEKDMQIENLAKEREVLLSKMAELNELLKELKIPHSVNVHGAETDLTSHQRHHRQENINTLPHQQQQIEGKIINLISEISSSSLIENFHPCAVCSGRLMTV